jgi:hypothetical protein
MTTPTKPTAGTVNHISAVNPDTSSDHSAPRIADNTQRDRTRVTAGRAPERRKEASADLPDTGIVRALGKGLLALAALAVGGTVAHRHHRPQPTLGPAPQGAAPTRAADMQSWPQPLERTLPAASSAGPPLSQTGPRRSVSTPVGRPRTTTPAPSRPSTEAAKDRRDSAASLRDKAIRDWAFTQASKALTVNPVRPWT